MRFLKILFYDIGRSSRDRREIAVVQELGVDVTAMSKPEKEGANAGVSNVAILNPTTRPLGELIPAAVNRVVSIFTWVNLARRQKVDIISGHDLAGLTVA